MVQPLVQVVGPVVQDCKSIGFFPWSASQQGRRVPRTLLNATVLVRKKTSQKRSPAAAPRKRLAGKLAMRLASIFHVGILGHMITDTYIISTGLIKFVDSIRQTFNITCTYIGTECMRIIGIQWNE
jgi:hypothetical protein